MQILSARAAADLIKDGDTVVISGVVSLISAEAALKALSERFQETGSPNNLTIICPCRTGWLTPERNTTGLEHLAHPHMVKRLITSIISAQDTPKLVDMAIRNEIEGYIFPMGVLFRWLRECTAKSPGLLTTVGMETFFDPGNAAGGDMRINRAAAESDLVKRIEIDGKQCLYVRSIPINAAIVKGTVCDTHGNISLSGEPISAGVRQMAMAARTSGGHVIAVVNKLTEHGTLHPRMIEIPGIFVDTVIVDPQAPQSKEPYEPAFTGEVRTPSLPKTPIPLDHQKIILRRAALELERGDIVNLGFGMGSQLPALAIEEHIAQHLTFSVEHGAVGGIPASGMPGKAGAFGAHFNPSAIIDSLDLFDFYQGGGLNATMLGFAQVDAHGNVNVSRYNGAVRGPGGFIDITHRTRKILIGGTLTSGGLQTEIELDSCNAPRLRIVREGRHRKFVQQVEQIDLYAQKAYQSGQRVFIITERCVFTVQEKGLTLIEVAPGIDIERDIQQWLDFELRIADDVKMMPDILFLDKPMELAANNRFRSSKFDTTEISFG